MNKIDVEGLFAVWFSILLVSLISALGIGILWISVLLVIFIFLLMMLTLFIYNKEYSISDIKTCVLGSSK